MLNMQCITDRVFRVFLERQSLVRGRGAGLHGDGGGICWCGAGVFVSSTNSEVTSTTRSSEHGQFSGH